MGKSLLTIAAIVLVILAIYFVYEIGQESTTNFPKENVELANGAHLEWSDCWFDAPTYIQCARFHTAPEGSSQTSSFVLPVVVFRQKGFSRKKDPVLYMAGGPGSGAGLEKVQIEGYWIRWFNEAKLNRDLVLFDQRGTGLSEPQLSCPEYHSAMRESFSRDIPSDQKALMSKEALEGCYTKMKDAGIPVDDVSTLHSAADVRDLMDALGYAEWNLHGVSYSTRLAMVIERKTPGRVRTMLLDSVYPIQKHFFKEWPDLLNASLDRIFELCNSQAACKREYGHIETKFWETMADLRENPLVLPTSNPTIGLKEVVFDDEIFIDFLFDSQYESGMLYDLPAVIDAFHNRDKELLVGFVDDYLSSRLQSSVSEIVFRTIECRDNPTPDKEEIIAIYDKYPKLKPYLSLEYDVCGMWGLDESKNTKISQLMDKSDTPVLILAGEDDPVTPVSWVKDVLSLYTNVQMFSFPAISHTVMDKKDCGLELFRQFLDKPGVRPTADCRDFDNGGN